MESNNKMGQYTFGPEENGILNILSIFEQSLGQMLQVNGGQVEQIKYYETFNIKGIKDIDFQNIFITTEKDAKGKTSYHMYCKDISDEILSIDSDGNLNIKSELEAFFGEIDLEKIIGENEKEPGKLKGLSEKADSKEIEKSLKKQKGEDKETEEEQKEQIEQDLKEEADEDLKIVNYKKIKDSNLDKKMEETIGHTEEKGIAYSKKQETFVLVVKKDGKFERPEGFENAKPTMKTVYTVDNKGKQVEKKVPHALMQTNQENEELSITIDQYGYIDTGIVNKLNSNERVERQVEQQQGKDSNIKEESDKTPENLNYENLIRYEAKKAKVSVEEFKSYLNKTSGENLIEKIEEVHEIIEEQYAPNRNNR